MRRTVRLGFGSDAELAAHIRAKTRDDGRANPAGYSLGHTHYAAVVAARREVMALLRVHRAVAKEDAFSAAVRYMEVVGSVKRVKQLVQLAEMRGVVLPAAVYASAMRSCAKAKDEEGAAAMRSKLTDVQHEPAAVEAALLLQRNRGRHSRADSLTDLADLLSLRLAREPREENERRSAGDVPALVRMAVEAAVAPGAAVPAPLLHDACQTMAELGLRGQADQFVRWAARNGFEPPLGAGLLAHALSAGDGDLRVWVRRDSGSSLAALEGRMRCAAAAADYSLARSIHASRPWPKNTLRSWRWGRRRGCGCWPGPARGGSPPA
eukprot:TRINITY_DN15601_c0_g1_i2.p2 TRINITY_DN15601_c0_g1~~TRINITY_DN15601_c0_g1_i2.p2  ORF type:complete len:323 (+),score=111.71 TRINITY_DN15601_c0_g1_i2:199-1167(+)